MQKYFNKFQLAQNKKTFISLDRLIIEPFFRDCKINLGLNGYQVRSEKSILRYLIITLVSYSYSKLSSGVAFNLNNRYKKISSY